MTQKGAGRNPCISIATFGLAVHSCPKGALQVGAAHEKTRGRQPHPVCHRYTFCSHLRPVKSTCRAFFTTTTSPESFHGENVGLSFPCLQQATQQVGQPWSVSRQRDRSFTPVQQQSNKGTTAGAIRMAVGGDERNCAGSTRALELSMTHPKQCQERRNRCASRQQGQAHLEDDGYLRGQAPHHLLFCINQAKAQPRCLDPLSDAHVSECWTRGFQDAQVWLQAHPQQLPGRHSAAPRRLHLTPAQGCAGGKSVYRPLAEDAKLQGSSSRPQAYALPFGKTLSQSRPVQAQLLQAGLRWFTRAGSLGRQRSELRQQSLQVLASPPYK